MMKKRKKILSLFLALGTLYGAFTINLNNAFANSTTIYEGTGTQRNPQQVNEGEENKITETSAPDSDGWYLTCVFTISSTVSASLNAEMYDTTGRLQNINNLEESLAGRYVGLNVYETKTHTKTATLDSLTKSRTRYTCTFCPGQYVCKDEETPTTPPESNTGGSTGGGGGSNVRPGGGNNVSPNYSTMMSNKNIYNYIQPIVSNCKNLECNMTMKTVKEYVLNECKGKNPSELTDNDGVITDADKAWCAARMSQYITGTVSMSKSNTIKYKDSNNINTTAENDSDRYNTTFEDNGDNGTCTTSSSGGTESRTHRTTCKWNYNRNNKNKVCLNVKNGKITYVEKSTDCNGDERYIATPPGTNYWYYFIPLNANSTNDFKIEMNSTSKIEAPICKDIIDTNEHWIMRITDSLGNEFEKNTSKNGAKTKVENGCYLKTTITIPVEQKFYNEIARGTKFKGFNFYYKPIPTNLSTLDDIEKKVFPNGISESSIWKDWYDNTSKDKVVAPNLTNENITYVAEVSNNINKIRNHNKNYPYTTWENMITTGASSFITNNTDIFPIQDNNYYKLGCGPANDNTTDHLYQRWCGTE